MVSAMEDTGTLQALTFLQPAGRVDLNRVLGPAHRKQLRSRPPGSTPAESLAQMAKGNYPAYIESLEAAETVGDKVVRDIVDHLARRARRIFLRRQVRWKHSRTEDGA